MTNIVPLGDCQPTCLINNEAVAMAERLLERLKSGDDVGFAYVSVRPDGTSTHGWNVASGLGNDAFAGIARLQFEMLKGD